VTKTISLASGESALVPVRLDAAPVATGLLSFDTTPWSVVFLGSTQLGETPIVNRRLPAGRHKLTILRQGKPPAREITITIEPNRVVSKRLDL
jgi:hypothetical protein